MAFNDAQNTLMNPLASIANLLGSGQQMTPDQQDRASAQNSMMGQLGALLIAGGQRMTPQARAAIIAGAAPVIGGYQKDVLSAAQARLMQAKATQEQEEQQRQQAIQQRLQDPAFAQSLGMTPEQASLLGVPGAIDVLKARAARDPMDAAYKAAMIKKLSEGDARQYQVIGKRFDENTGQYVDIYGYPPMPGEQPTPQAQPQSQPSIFDKIGDKRNQEALDIIKKEMPAIGQTVEGMVMGNIPYSPSLIKTPRGEMIDSLVRMVDPSYSPTTYDSRKAMQLDYTKGKSSIERKNADTALRHFLAAYQNSDLLPENDLSILSTGKNALDIAQLRRSGNVNSPEMQKLARFDNTIEVGGDEMAKFLGIGSEGGREAIKKMFDPSQGRGIVREKLRNQIRLAKEKLNVLDENWKSNMGPAANRMQVITPEMEEAFKVGDQRPMSQNVATKAREAIQQGANRDEVVRHLIEQGFDPAGL